MWDRERQLGLENKELLMEEKKVKMKLKSPLKTDGLE
jgi:hypothetical protein